MNAQLEAVTPRTDLPAAWLGYRFAPDRSDVIVRICAWCPDKDEAEREARRLDLDITHAICPACYQAQLERRAP
jgi:hypothetical protein